MNFFFIRGLCALGVFINHFNGLLKGFIFVWIFFSISGYLLTKKLDKEKKLSYLNFIKNRALRLLPTYYFVQIVSIIIVIFLYKDLNYNYKSLIKELIVFFIPPHIPNFYNTMEIFNSPLWSLQLEIYFCIIIYFLVKFFKITISFVVFLILLHLIFYFNSLNIFPIHYPSFFYNIIFFISGFLAYFLRKYFQFKSYMSIFFLFLIFILPFLKIEDDILLAKIPLLFFFLIIPAISYFDNNKKIIKYTINPILNIFIFLGVISYPFYLVHKIILNLFNRFYLNQSLFSFFIIFFLTIIVSYFIHIFVEKKFRY